ncbi:MAG: imidazolonepropionase [Bdellovibrionota bacterium]
MRFFAEKIASPILGRGFRVVERACLEVDRGKIRSLESLSLSKWRLVSSKLKHPCIIPGLIDPHTHLVFAGERSNEWAERLEGLSYQEIAKRGGGIQSTVRATRAADKKEIEKIAKQRLREALAFGITTIEIKSGYGLDLDTELKTLKIIQALKKKSKIQILSTFLGAHALNKNFKSTSHYVDWLIENLLPKVARLADFQDVFVEKNYFGVRESIRLLEAGKRWGLKPKVHAHEFGRTGGLKVAAATHAVSADHLQFLNSADIRLMKKKKIIPVVLPGTSFFLGAKKFAPARAMWDQGLKVAIASDFNPGTNPSFNAPLMGTLGAIHYGLSLKELLTAQTYHAALALDLKDRGILAPGFKADFICLKVPQFETMYYYYGQNFVDSVFIDGKKVF